MVTNPITTNPSTTSFIFEGDFMNAHLVVKAYGSQVGSRKKFNDFNTVTLAYYLLPSICKKRKKGEKRGIGGGLPEVSEQLVVGSRSPILNAIQALTTGYLEHNGQDVTTTAGLLQRSCSHELREIEASLGAKGQTRLFAIADAIDEALEALEEASQ